MCKLLTNSDATVRAGRCAAWLKTPNGNVDAAAKKSRFSRNGRKTAKGIAGWSAAIDQFAESQY
jgi:hypothetical protein